jgi:DNA-binding CsgD family transcriptional regulator
VTQLVASDYGGMLEFLGVALDADGPDPFPRPVLDQFRRLIPCDTVSYHEWSFDGRLNFCVSSDDEEAVLDTWRAYPAFHHQDPLPAGFGDEASIAHVPRAQALRFSDVISLREFRRLDLHREVCRPLGVDYVMKIFLPVTTGGTAFVFDAGCRDFTERDRAVLDVLAPHLTRLHRRAASQRPPAAAASILTSREQQVMRLVAEGLSNGEVANALFLAPGTVRKHLDNIYAKLGVHNRTAAVSVYWPSSELEQATGRALP